MVDEQIKHDELTSHYQSEGKCECNNKDEHGVCEDCGQEWHKEGYQDGCGWAKTLPIFLFTATNWR